MTDYMQRLIASARTPNRAIRPLSGSLFSAPAVSSIPENFQPQEQAPPGRPPESLAMSGLPFAEPAVVSDQKPDSPNLPQKRTQKRAAPVHSQTGESPEEDSKAESSIRHLEDESDLAQAASHDLPSTHATEQKVPPAQTQSPLPEAAVRREASSLAYQLPGAPLRTRFKPSTNEGTQPSTQTFGTGAEHRLIETEPVPERRTQEREQGFRQAFFALQPSRSRPAQEDPTVPLGSGQSNSLIDDTSKIRKEDFSRAIGRELAADEIQIHIGRIEVTAAPPPPVPPARPVRKSLNLDEYLKRGRGGGRE